MKRIASANNYRKLIRQASPEGDPEGGKLMIWETGSYVPPPPLPSPLNEGFEGLGDSIAVLESALDEALRLHERLLRIKRSQGRGHHPMFLEIVGNLRQMKILMNRI
jgi:hypothetical protein